MPYGTMPFPATPDLSFMAVQVGDHVPLICVDVDDANALKKWMDKIAAFKAAWID